MTKLVFVALAVMAAGCGAADDVTAITSSEVGDVRIDSWREIPAPAGASMAVSVVSTMFRLQGTPHVHWYGGIGLDCDDPSVIGWIIPGSVPARCVGGLQMGDDLVLVADRPELVGISATSLAHELAHMRSLEVTGDPDLGHLSHWFAQGGEVVQAKAMLAEMGL